MGHTRQWIASRLFATLTFWGIAAVAHAVPAHYIVVREDAAGALSVLHRSVVELDAIPRLEASRDWDGDGHRLQRRLSVKALAGDKVVHETDVATSRHLRHEHTHGHSMAHAARHFESADHVYVVRLPVSGGATRAVVSRARGARLGSEVARKSAAAPIEIDLRAPLAKSAKAAADDVITILDNGPPSNRLDLLILGDGYTADQREKFRQDATNAVQRFFEVSPYAEYRPMVNAKALFVASSQSGADKPACAETPGSAVVQVDTAFDATYCAMGIRRLVTVNADKVFTAAAAVPGYDKIIVLVNDAEYGGSGGGFIVSTLNPMVAETMRHEFGHTFTLLADEYESAYPGYPACSDAPGSANPCEANVSDRVSPLKWNDWVEPGTPLPSGTQGFPDRMAAGAWEGARYTSKGMYRQCFQGMMRDSTAPFCLVDSEAFVLRLYGAGWGAPAGGIVPIEPGTQAPASGSVAASTGSSLSLGARVVAPVSGVLAEWRVDGGLVKSERLASGAQAQFSYTVLSGGHAVALTVIDDSPMLLRPRTWTVSWQVTGTSPSGGTTTLSVAPSQLAFGGQSINTASPGQRVTVTNTGSSSVTPAFSVPQGFSIVQACGTLAPGASCQVDVAFRPASEGAIGGSLTVSAAAFATSVALSGTGERSLVTHYYRSIFGRAPDSAGHQYWTAEAQRVARLGANVNEAWFAMAMAFFSTPEYAALGRTDAAYLDDLYATFFNRPADPEGRNYWLGLMARGLPRGVVLAGFMFSPEFTAFTRGIFGDTAARAEVDVVMDFYRGLLGRLPDDAGFNYWVGRFRAAQCSGGDAVNREVEAISSLFLSSAEYAQRGRSTAQFVGDLYNAFLRRGGDLDGVSFWVGEVDSGRRTRDAARGSFLSSPEFQARVTAVTRQGCSR